MIYLLDEDVFRILTLFSLSRGVNLKREEIKKKTFLNNVSLNKALAILNNSGFLSKKNSLYCLNFNNKENEVILNMIYQEYDKLKHLPLKEYFMIVEIVSSLLAINSLFDLYLFGSYSKLTFREKSDIDFAVISEKVDKTKVNSVISKLEKKYNKSIEIHYFNKNFYNNKKDPLVKDILQNGVQI